MRDCFLVLVVLAAMLGACAPGANGTDGAALGVVQGRVTIGPLEPVSRPGGPDPTPSREVYAARKIMVYEQDGETPVRQADIRPDDGTYRVELPAGSYVVDINHAGIDSAAGFPKTVTLRAGETVTLDVDIDTGIR